MRRKTRSVNDPILMALAILASLIGLLFIFDAGYARSLRDGRGIIPREFIMQLITLPVAMFLGWQAGKIRTDKLQKWAGPIWAVVVVSLVLCMIPPIGVSMNGAHRWIRFPGFQLQPAEFAKLAAVLYLAAAFAKRKAWPENIKRRKDWAHWMDTIVVPKAQRALPLVWVMLGVLLIEIEPDLGTAAVVGATAGVMIFVGGISKKSIIACVALCVLGVGVLVVKQPYRMERITSHGDRWSIEHVDDNTYQTVQSEVAMAGGGITGEGLGNGRAKHVLPATTTDFVLATIAEETGLLGSWLILAVMGGLAVRIFYLAQGVKDRFPKLVLTGVGAWIGVQACVNMMMANAFMPPIGIPMPFISSGGSSLLALWLAVGLCQSMLRPAPVKGEVLAISDHRWRNRGAHLSGARSRAAVR